MFIACFKIFLVIINIIFLIIGLVLTAAGIIVAFFAGELLESALEEAKNAAATGSFSIFSDSKSLTDLPFLYEIGLFLMVLGLLLTVVSFMGCFGPCCRCCRILLMLFAISMFVLVVLEIIGFSLFLAKDSPVHSEIRSNLKAQIPNPWKDRGTDSYTMALNLMNYNFDCCGIDGVSDFSQKPFTCKSHTEGCYTKLQDAIDDYVVYTGLVVAAILLIQVLEAIFAIVVYKDSNKVSPQ